MAARVEATRRFLEAHAEPTDTLLAVVDELFAPNLVTHGDALAQKPVVHGTKTLKEELSAFKRAFPDATVTIHKVFGQGDKVMARMEIAGTHMDVFHGVPATNKKMSWTASSIMRFNDDDKVAERWAIQDQLGILVQLGRISL